MFRRKGRNLTVRIFLLTFTMLLAASLVTYGILAFVTPVSYETVSTEVLEEGLDVLADSFASAEYADINDKIPAFCNEYNAHVMIFNPDDGYVEVFFPNEVMLPDGSTYTVTEFSKENSSEDSNLSFYTGTQGDGGGTGEYTIGTFGSHFISESTGDTIVSISRTVSFTDREGDYILYVLPQKQPVNAINQAFVKTVPLLLLAVLLFSALCSYFYTRFMTKLREQNAALERDIEQERRREAERLAFFSAVSHELKTPITVLKGQLTGMLDGVDVYRDRDKYLARALGVTGRMEGMVQELLTVARMETLPVNDGTADLSALLRKSLEFFDELISQKEMKPRVDITEGVTVRGSEQLLSKALGSILSNAVFYSPDGAELSVTLTGHAALTVVNCGAAIPEDALPHLFEPFYRAEKSRSRATGGSGMGLYLVKLILERAGAEYGIENTKNGVRFTVKFVGENKHSLPLT